MHLLQLGVGSLGLTCFGPPASTIDGGGTHESLAILPAFPFPVRKRAGSKVHGTGAQRLTRVENRAGGFRVVVPGAGVEPLNLNARL